MKTTNLTAFALLVLASCVAPEPRPGLIHGDIVPAPEPAALFPATKRSVQAARTEAQAEWNGGFTLLGQATPAKEQTRFKAFYDPDGTLRLRVECLESQMGKLQVSSRPDAGKRDAEIENQDVVCVLLGIPALRHREYWLFCVNSAGEVSDTLMSWSPGKPGWFHRKATCGDFKAKASKGGKSWTVELSLRDGWGGISFASPWALQIVRMERPSGEVSSWNPSRDWPQALDQAGFVMLGRPLPPQVGEWDSITHFKGNVWLQRVVARKAGAVGTMFVKRELKASDIKGVHDGYSNALDFSVRDDKGGVLLASYWSLPAAEAEAFGSLPDLKLLTLERNPVSPGDMLPASYFLPLDDDQLARAALTVSVKDAKGTLVATETRPLPGRKGSLILDVSKLPCGAYAAEIEARGLHSSAPFAITQDELYGD